MSIDGLEISLSKLVEIINKFNGFPLRTIKETDVEEVKTELLGKGHGFMSNVYRCSVKLTKNQLIKFVVKRPNLSAFDIVNQNAHNPFQIEDRTVLDGFNTECDFYRNACQLKMVIPAAHFYYAENIDKTSIGYIFMEDLNDRATMAGMSKSLSINQMLNLAKYIAKMQFYARKGKLADWQNKIERLPVHLQEFYLLHLPGAMPELLKIPEIQQLLPSIQPIFDRKFAFYALLDKPKEYNALSFCHGDLYSNNIFVNGDEIAAIIDFQLTFKGSALFDLGRCVVLSLDDEIRDQIEEKVFDSYYEQLTQLYTKYNEKIPFSREQAYELYVLCICQQTVFIVAFVGLFSITERKSNGDLPECFEIIKRRAIMSMKRCAHLIEKHNLARQ